MQLFFSKVYLVNKQEIKNALILTSDAATVLPYKLSARPLTVSF